MNVTIKSGRGCARRLRRDNVHIFAVNNAPDIVARSGRPFNFALGAVRHVNNPFPVNLTDVHRHLIHALCFVAKEVLVSHAVHGVYAHQLWGVGLVPRPCTGGGVVLVDGVLHADGHRPVLWLGITRLAIAALPLAVGRTVFGIEEVGDVFVHLVVYLLHTTLGTVVVEVGPCQVGHARCGGHNTA